MTNLDLINYAESCVGSPCWHGCKGETATIELLKKKTFENPLKYQRQTYIRCISELGQRVFDDVGLINSFIGQNYSAFELFDFSNEKGKIDTMPDIKGVLVFFNQSVGIYLGGSEVITTDGEKVVKQKINARPWQRWAKCLFVAYPEKEVKKHKINRLGTLYVGAVDFI